MFERYQHPYNANIAGTVTTEQAEKMRQDPALKGYIFTKIAPPPPPPKTEMPEKFTNAIGKKRGRKKPK